MPGDGCDQHCVASQPVRRLETLPSVTSEMPANGGLLRIGYRSPGSQIGRCGSEIADSLRRIFEIFPFLGDSDRRPSSIGTAWAVAAPENRPRLVSTNNGGSRAKLKDSIQQGRLLHIELINYKEKNLGFDEAKFISSVRRDMNLSIAKALPQGNALKFLEKVKEYAKKNDYEAMRVRWREPQAAKAHTAKVDTARSDAGEALFVKFAEIKLRQPLPDICDTMSDELISKIKDFVG